MYKPSDLDDAVKARMVNIHPATAIMVRGLGTDAENEIATITFSGWMSYEGTVSDPGPGFRLWTGTATLGAKTFTEKPLASKLWPSATYFEPDAWVGTADTVGATEKNSTNEESCLLLPTLGYTYILAEVVFTSVTSFGLMWSPLQHGKAEVTF